ncbi:hypothetical protein [uncultured Chitinophaga sp.]|jgi:Phosphatidylinositol-specific phospholipase C, X domain.|uniref:hypothetical protein n=1 Tax=uncultured Chitinophaga sp. TaxID=339340 RepID=UPI002605FB3A|nr:hypothetical protein [uncultured Chitinophaga sp.]
MMIRFLFLGALFCYALCLQAQNLSFTAPVNFLPQAATDKAIDITSYHGGYFVAWKESGPNGAINVSFLGRRHDTAFVQTQVKIPNSSSNFAPVLQVMNDRLYLLWISANGGLHYVISNSDTGFNAENIFVQRLDGPWSLSYGLSTTVVHGQLMLVSHAANRSTLVYAILEPEQNGTFKTASVEEIYNVKAADYPFVVSLTDTDVRLCWRGYKGQDIYYADYNVHDASWKDPVRLEDAETGAAPALYHVWNSRHLFYIWKGPKNDNRIYYTTAADGIRPGEQKVLPAYFSTGNPVAVCELDSNNFIMAYTGADNRFYLSYFASYDPASWMQDLFHPHRADLSLKDIVIPGSHDAGMSVLSGTGGQMKDAINSCNTLTQRLPIRSQLEEGIRMFDLRIGKFANALYTKHAQSDCDADAVGAGYGEKFSDVLDGLRSFLEEHKMETVILNFSHFCDADVPTASIADTLVASLGGHLFSHSARKLAELQLKDLAGKVIVVFEQRAYHNGTIDSCTIADASGAFINYRRKYAATNDMQKLLAAQLAFFNSMKDGVSDNDLVRLDWQLTQSGQEAALICNGYRPDKTGALVSGVILLANALKKNETILDLSAKGNRLMLPTLSEWIANGTINPRNKPNILYVDVAGSWITDYCIDLNNSRLYRRD